MGDRAAESLSPPALEAVVVDALRAVAPADRRAIVAVSGGVDSLALLHLLAATAPRHGLRLHVVHVDHGIHPDSGLVADRVAAAARGLDLPVEVVTLDLGPGASETGAREARYRVLNEARDRLGASIILTAHHRDDQIETVLMRVLRGSGPAGLSGMAFEREGLVRPMLGVGRDELEGYLEARGIAAWEDPANLDPTHLRSWIRGSLLPVLRKRLPDVEDRLLDLARQAGADREAWGLLPEVLGLDFRAERDGFSVASGRLRAYDSRLARALVLAVCRQAGAPAGPAAAKRVLDLVRSGVSGGRADLGGGWVAENRFDRLAILPDRQPVADAAELAGSEGSLEWGPWWFRWRSEAAPDRLEREGWTTWLSPGEYRVAAWAPADRIRPLGGRGSRLVVRCMQERKVGRGERSGWPLVSSEDAVVWVPGVCRGAERVPVPGTEAVRVDVEHGQG